MKTNRSTSRLFAVQILYESFFGERTVDVILKDYLAGNTGTELLSENPYTGKEEAVSVIPPDTTLLSGLVSAYLSRRDDIEAMLTASLTANWTKERTDSLLWAILSAGVAELLSYPETPTAVVLNEYVDIAESFYSRKSPELSVANGILNKIAKSVREE